jgi:hypothetical protein
MRGVRESFGAVAVGGPDHVVLVIINVVRWIVARWEVDIGTKRRSITITVLIGEPDTSSSISGILNSGTV